MEALFGYGSGSVGGCPPALSQLTLCFTQAAAVGVSGALVHHTPPAAAAQDRSSEAGKGQTGDAHHGC